MEITIRIRSINNSILFEHRSENNTIKTTIIEAINKGIDLSEADLKGIYESENNLRLAGLINDTDLSVAVYKKIQPYFQIIPEEGSFIAWKKCDNGCIVKLEIPAKAKRHNSLGGRKCSASYVKTLQIWDNEGGPISESHFHNMIYKVGRLTKSDNGITFFLTKKEALD